MIEGSGSIPLTSGSGSGSGRPKTCGSGESESGSGTLLLRIKNNKISFQYMLTELKQLVRMTIEKLPLSSKNYAAVFRNMLLTTCRQASYTFFSNFCRLHNSLISILMRTQNCFFYFVADPDSTFPKTKMVYRYSSIALILCTVFAKCLSSYHYRTVAKFENILDYQDEIARDVRRRLCQCLLYIFHKLLMLETSPVNGLYFKSDTFACVTFFSSSMGGLVKSL
jgi:hypothetical protein